MKMTKSAAYNPCCGRKTGKNINVDFHDRPYVLSGKELFTGLLIFFFLGAGFGVLFFRVFFP